MLEVRRLVRFVDQLGRRAHLGQIALSSCGALFFPRRTAAEGPACGASGRIGRTPADGARTVIRCGRGSVTGAGRATGRPRHGPEGVSTATGQRPTPMEPMPG